MEKTLPDRQSVWIDPLRSIRALGAALLLGFAAVGTASAQQVAVTGTVTSTGGTPLAGVAVAVQGTTTRTLTTENGRYFINAPSDGVLTFVLFGRKPVQASVAGRARIDVTMAQVTYLEEVVVTGYTEQRRGDITGAVSSVNIESTQRPTTASVLQRLDVVPGITVASSGSPGSRSTVRIRGISSFQNNDPLYVIDGVPVQDSYINFLNPNDISSMQVLKDASSASVYGSRASNGVILIETTKRGASGAPKMVATLRTGRCDADHGYDKFLINNSLDYFKVVEGELRQRGFAGANEYLRRSQQPDHAGLYIRRNGREDGRRRIRPAGRCGHQQVCLYQNNLIQPGSAGTNWWDAVFGEPGKVQDLNLSISGAGANNGYGVSFNYFNQDGTAAYNNFRRGNIRVNSSFNQGKLSFGENVALSGERHYGGLPDDQGGETALIGKNILMQPVVPIYDVMGNFASGKAVTLGNNTNPLKAAYDARNNITSNNRVFGNVYAGFAVMPTLQLRSSLGFSVNQGANYGYNGITPENSEPNLSDNIFDNSNTSNEFTFSNTLTYSWQKSQHGFNALLGQEAVKGTSRSINSSLSNLLSNDLDSRFVQDALGDASTKVVNSFGGHSALLSYFGKLDYNFADKYVASATVRRDGSSRLGPNNRCGTFPAFGLGWRISKETFLENNHFLSDVMLRFGFGVTGNQSIPTGRIVDQYGGSNGDTYYDIAGTNTSVRSGYRQTSLGNPDLKWEENTSTERRRRSRVVRRRDQCRRRPLHRTTNNLLFNPAIPATAGYASAPIVNIGEMSNNGYDLSIGHQGANWNATLTGSQYKNKIVKIDGVQTFFYGPSPRVSETRSINQLGSPIGSFYGLRPMAITGMPPMWPRGPKQDGAAPGRIKFVDTNGDGAITDADRVDHRQPAPEVHGRTRPRIPRWKLRPDRQRVRHVRQQDLRRTEGVLRLPRLLDERAHRSPRRVVDAAEPQREVPASSTERHLQQGDQQLLRRGRLVRAHAQPAAGLQRPAVHVEVPVGDASLRPGRESVHLHRLLGSRSVPADGERQWIRRRHPRPVSAVLTRASIPAARRSASASRLRSDP